MVNKNTLIRIKDTCYNVMDVGFKELNYLFIRDYKGYHFPNDVSEELINMFCRVHLLILIQNAIERNNINDVNKYISTYILGEFELGPKIKHFVILLNSNAIKLKSRSCSLEVNIYNNLLLCKYEYLLNNGYNKIDAQNIISDMHNISANTVNTNIKKARKCLFFKNMVGKRYCYFMMLRFFFINGLSIDGFTDFKNIDIINFIKKEINITTMFPKDYTGPFS